MTMRILMIVTSNGQMGDGGKHTGVWAEELAVPYYRFLDAGMRIDLASPRGGAMPLDPASTKADGGDPSVSRFVADASLQKALASLPRVRDLDVSSYDALFFPGGHGTMWDLPLDEGVTNAVESAFARGKIIGALCHGGAALVSARRPDGMPIVHDRRINAFTDREEAAVGLTDIVPFQLESRLRKLGARFEGAPNWQPFAVRDGQFVTGQNPQSSRLVADLVLETLAHRAETKHTAAA